MHKHWEVKGAMDKEYTMKMLMIGLLSVVGVSMSAPVFAGCWQDVEVTSYTAETNPAAECLDLSVEGNECTGGATLTIVNNCEDDLVLFDPTPLTIVASETSYVTIMRDGDTTFWSNDATLGEAALTIAVEYDSKITNESDEGCFASTTGKPNLTPLLFLGFFALIRRR
jgi:hypothetical protein